MMKHIIFLIILFSSLIFSAGSIRAQQPKAFETVKYSVRKNNSVFYLDYSSGYIGASQIRLVRTHQKPQLFTPESGTPKTNGDFILALKKGSEKREITLIHINEEVEAPKTIHARYREKGVIFNLLFLKIDGKL